MAEFFKYDVILLKRKSKHQFTTMVPKKKHLEAISTVQRDEMYRDYVEELEEYANAVTDAIHNFIQDRLTCADHDSIEHLLYHLNDMGITYTEDEE